jgi:hypothetical protein
MDEKVMQGLKVEQVVIYAKPVGFDLHQLEDRRINQLKLEIFI